MHDKHYALVCIRWSCMIMTCRHSHIHSIYQEQLHSILITHKLSMMIDLAIFSSQTYQLTLVLGGAVASSGSFAGSLAGSVARLSPAAS